MNSGITDSVKLGVSQGNSTGFLTAKPFLILAGASGTGKSRWVKKQAYNFWPQEREGTKSEEDPPNYCLISVRPNWHDSSEVIGYYSNLQKRYVETEFVRFLISAWKFWIEERKEHSDKAPTPFFLCLDEMNLAPVEQYFAEYLSIVETRKHVDTDTFGTEIPVKDYVVSKPLVSKTEFNRMSKDSDAWNEFNKSVGLDVKESNVKDPKVKSAVAAMLREHGLSLPPNLIVVGTVNMDETTHSFSRKVLDRAFVWEMPIGDLKFSLDKKAKLEYGNQSMDLARYTEGYDVHGLIKNDYGNNIVDILTTINGLLEDSPFKISYRVRDELLLLAYARNIENDDDLHSCMDDGLYSKILPRIEGDESRTGKVLTKLLKWLIDRTDLGTDKTAWENLRKALESGYVDEDTRQKTIPGPEFFMTAGSEDPFSTVKPWRRSLAKVRSMLLKLDGQFTSFWD